MKKFAIQHKKSLVATAIAVAILLAVGGIVWGLLWNVPKAITDIDLTLDTVKLDRQENEVGTAQIHITGKYREYVFREGRLELTIDAFDGLENIQTGKKADYVYFQDYGCGYIPFNADYTTRGYTEVLHLYFTDEFDRLIIQRRGDVRYIGSVSGNYTLQECISYFENLENDWDYVKSSQIDIMQNAVEMDKNGKELGKVQFRIEGYYRNYLLGENNLYMECDFPDNGTNFRTANNAALSLMELPAHNIAFGSLLLSRVGINNEIEDLRFRFTDEFDRFIIINEENSLFYVGSVSEKYTAREIVEYFNSFFKTGITLPEA